MTQQAPLMVAEEVPEQLPSGPDLPNLELTPTLFNDLFVAEVALQRDQYGVAVESYARLSAETRDPRIVDRATRVALFVHDYEAALGLSELWVELDPNNVDAGQILTLLLVKDGDYDAAVDSLERVVQHTADDEISRYRLMIRLFGSEQDREGVLEVMRLYIDRHPDDDAALYAGAQLELQAEKLEQAEITIDQLLRHKPDWSQAVILRARILQKTERMSEALDYLGSVVARKGKDIELRAFYGRMLADADRLDEALEQFRRVLKAEPENNSILYAAGLVALQTEEIDEAKKYFLNLNERAVMVNDTSFYLGRIEEVQENYPEAIRRYASVSRGKSYINAQVRRALLQARAGEVDTALAHLHEVQSRNPNLAQRLFMVEGEILRDVGHFDEALAVYEHALKEIPDDPELLYAHAMVAEKLGQIDVLERNLLSILERFPDHVDSLNSLGYTLADRTDRIDEAYDYVERALALKPDSHYVMDSMGWVLYRQGKLDEALAYLQKAIQGEGGYVSEIAAHLGEVLWVKGDFKGARAVWKKALEENPDNAEVLNVMKRLEK